MTNTGASSPFIKDEPEDHLFNPMHRFSHTTQQGNNHQQYGMNQQQYNHYGSTPGGGQGNGSINPNDLSMPMSVNTGSYMAQNNSNGQFQFNNGHQQQGQKSNPNASFNVGNSAIEDDDLLSLDTYGQDNHFTNGLPQSNQGFNNIEEFDLGGSIYPTQTGAMNMGGHSHLNDNIYSSTPDGDPIQSPFVHSYHQQLSQRMGFGGQIGTPQAFAGSPLASELHVGSGPGDNYMSASNPRQRPSIQMARHSSDNRSPSVLTPKTPGLGVGSLNINGGGHHAQPIKTSSHRKTPSQQWDYGASLQSFPGSSPVQPGMHGLGHPNSHISDVLKAGSMPAKLSGQQNQSAPAMQTQEMKRRRRRESHNLVERRRRDNINERIQELSHLVPAHRLEDEKVRKALQNNSPLSPVLGGQSMSPPKSGMGGRGVGSVTQGLPIEEKDKGPNKGDILNGSVGWTRDLMWMLSVKMEQMEELSNTIAELGGVFPFELSEDERRMGSELKDAMRRNGWDRGGEGWGYSRTAGTGLRVPRHTDYRGDPIGGSGGSGENTSPEVDGGVEGLMGWSGQNSGGSGPGSHGEGVFKEEDEYGMDLTQ